MKIADFVNKLSSKYQLKMSSNISEFYSTIYNYNAYNKNLYNLVDSIYALYEFNKSGDIIIIASSNDKEYFSNLTYYSVGSGLIENISGDKVSLSDAGLEFAKRFKNKKLNSISTWEEFYLNNFVSKKVLPEDIKKDILNDYIRLQTQPDIETITEGYIDGNDFNSFVSICVNSNVPQVLIVIASVDNQNVSNYWALKLDDNLSNEDYENLLNEINL